MDGVIYDLLMGHEIGHALYTPMQGWHDAQIPASDQVRRPNIKTFLNVVEDARIEKLIKANYPGLRRPFAEAYQKLFDQDLFQIKRLKGDYSKLNLIDRINLFFKLGAQTLITFDKEEQVFVNRTAAAMTWDEVVQIARDVYDYCKVKEPKKQEQKKQDKQESEDTDGQEPDTENEDGDDSEQDADEPADGDEPADADESDDTEESEKEDGEKSDDADDSEEESDEEGDESEAGDDADEEESDDADESDGVDADDESDEDGEDSDLDKGADAGDDAGSTDEDEEADAADEQPEPQSITDKAFRAQEQNLLDRTAKSQIVMDIPTANLNNIIVPNRIVYAKFEQGARALLIKRMANFETVAAGLSKAFHARNKAQIGVMVQEFEQKKNANQYARQLTSKTGVIDSLKLSRYKFSNDIFRKVTTVSKGKNHGMVLFLDLSGSMDDQFRDIVEQLLVLTSFCKRINLPFDVYGFGDSFQYSGFRAGNQFNKTTDNTMIPNGRTFCLRHLLSSDFSANDYKRSFDMLNMVGQFSRAEHRQFDVSNVIRNWKVSPGTFGFDMGGTPFIQTLLASREIIEKFKTTHHTDITNVIYLTDGDGDVYMSFGNEYDTMPIAERQNIVMGFRDPRTKQVVMVNNEERASFQAAITKLIRGVTDCRHLGYYFGTTYSILDKVGDDPRRPELMKQLSKDGFLAISVIGYDMYYLVDQTTMEYQATSVTVEPWMKDDDQKAKALSDHMSRKKTAKLVARSFAAEVAK
jgi:hypothetical protein